MWTRGLGHEGVKLERGMSAVRHRKALSPIYRVGGDQLGRSMMPTVVDFQYRPFQSFCGGGESAWAPFCLFDSPAA
jgi:hypothetical protein